MNAWPSFLRGRSNSALVGELVADCEAVVRERGHAAAHSADKSAACSSESPLDRCANHGDRVAGSEPHGGPLNATVFDFDADYTSQAFRKPCTGAGIVGFRFHDLRHTAASWLRMTGADIHSVATLPGHKDIRMTARYSHLNPAFLGETIARLEGVLDNLGCQDVAIKPN